MFKILRAFARWWRTPQPERSFVVNEAAAPDRTRVNLSVAVNSSGIRVELLNNERYLVLPSYTLPNNVIMNRGLYPPEEIEKAYATLENTFAPLGHPMLDGEYIPAQHPVAVTSYFVGAHNRNVERRGDRIYVEKWVNIKYALNTEGGRALLERVNYDPETETLKGTPGAVHTSTGIFLRRDESAKGEGYDWTARDMVMDHDAILLNEQGAATPEQGVGLLVNSRVEDAVPLQGNAILADLSYGSLNRLLSEAATARWGGTGKWAWVEDFDNTRAIVRIESGAFAVGYSIKGGAVEWAVESSPVEQKTEWLEKNPIVNRILQLVGLGVNSGLDKPAPPTVEDAPDMTITPEQLSAALAANNTALAATLQGIFAPVATAIGEMSANQAKLTETLQANAKQAEAGKRAKVAERIGAAAADALTGNALDEAYATVVGTKPVVGGGIENNSADYVNTPLPE